MFKGEKWLRNASYLTEADVAKVIAVKDRAQEVTGERAGVRCPTYTGEPHPIATVVYGRGERIYEFVYR